MWGVDFLRKMGKKIVLTEAGETLLYRAAPRALMNSITPAGR